MPDPYRAVRRAMRKADALKGTGRDRGESKRLARERKALILGARRKVAGMLSEHRANRGKETR